MHKERWGHAHWSELAGRLKLESTQPLLSTERLAESHSARFVDQMSNGNLLTPRLMKLGDRPNEANFLVPMALNSGDATHLLNKR